MTPSAIEQFLSLLDESRRTDMIGRFDVIAQRPVKLVDSFLDRLNHRLSSPASQRRKPKVLLQELFLRFQFGFRNKIRKQTAFTLGRPA